MYAFLWLEVLALYILILLGHEDFNLWGIICLSRSFYVCSVQIQIICLWEIMLIEDIILLRLYR